MTRTWRTIFTSLLISHGTWAPWRRGLCGPGRATSVCLILTGTIRRGDPGHGLQGERGPLRTPFFLLSMRIFQRGPGTQQNVSGKEGAEAATDRVGFLRHSRGPPALRDPGGRG